MKVKFCDEDEIELSKEYLNALKKLMRAEMRMIRKQYGEGVCDWMRCYISAEFNETRKLFFMAGPDGIGGKKHEIIIINTNDGSVLVDPGGKGRAHPSDFDFALTCVPEPPTNNKG